MRPRACRRHLRSLLEFAVAEAQPAGSERSIEPAALMHLELCERCRFDVERERLVAYMVRRELAATGRRAAIHEARADPWPAVQARIARRAPRSRWTALMTLRGSLAPGLAAGLLIAVLGNAAPVALREGSAHDAATPSPAHVREAARVERRYDPARTARRGGNGDPVAVARPARNSSNAARESDVELHLLVAPR